MAAGYRTPLEGRSIGAARAWTTIGMPAKGVEPLRETVAMFDDGEDTAELRIARSLLANIMR
jgi:hypothetical protein